jgi:hypothetical protein
MLLEFIQDIDESITGRTPHPEDAIFAGSEAAAQQINNLKSVIANPAGLTIKWDGYPALIFGRLQNGRIGIADKYMFDRGVLVQSPEEWMQYDSQKSAGGLRGSLYDAAAALWPGLNAAVQGSGFYWADLMYSSKLAPNNGVYSFKPNLVEYRVAVNSPLGKNIGNSVAGVVVHQYFSEIGATPVPWNGAGLRNVPGGVAIIPPAAGNKYTLKTPVQRERAAIASLKQYGAEVDKLLGVLPQTTRDKIKTYFNKRITGQVNQPLHTWLENQISAKQYNVLVGPENNGLLFAQDSHGETVESPAYAGLNAIWNSIYTFKQNLAKQLEAQTANIQEFVNGHPAGEGFVFSTPAGMVKIVDRELFSAGLFAKMAEQ